MEVNPKDPKTLIGVAVVLAGALAGGSLLGFTIEPETTTKLRIEKATLEERSGNLEGQVTNLEGRVDLLEDLVAECSQAITTSRRVIEGE